MTIKLGIVFFILFLCQVCLSARIPRQSEATDADSAAKTADENITNLIGINVALDYDKIKGELEKQLTEGERNELNGIINGIKSAKTLDSGFRESIKLIEFGMKMAVNHTELSFESSENTTVANSNTL